MTQEEESEQDRRIHEALGESINPLYVRGLIEMPTADLLRWLQQRFVDEAHMMIETISLAESEHRAYRLGLSLHDGHLSLYAYVLKELASRSDAIEAATAADDQETTPHQA